MNILTIVFSFFLFLSCSSQKNEIAIVHAFVYKDSPVRYMRRHYKLKIWYQYTYEDVKYEGTKIIFKGETRYSQGDSICLKINKYNPQESEVIRKIEKQKKNVKFVSTVKKSSGIKAYSIVDKKPIFQYNGVSGETALSEYFLFKIKDIGVKEVGTVGISIVIGETGKIENQKIVKSANPFLDTVAIEIVKEMPHWKPAEYNGEKVEVAYLTEIKFNN